MEGETATSVQIGHAVHVPEDPSRVGGVPGIGTFMLRGNALAYDGGFGASSLNLELGAGVKGGFAYDIDLLLGPGTWIGERVGVAATGGLAIGSVYHRIPFAFRVPVQLTVAVHPVGGLFLNLWARGEWVTGEESVRQSGSTSLPFTDELRLGIDSWIGTSVAGKTDNLALSVGVGYAELMGTRFATARIAFGSAGLPPLHDHAPARTGPGKNGEVPPAPPTTPPTTSYAQPLLLEIQDFCPTFARVVAAAPDGFAAIRGAEGSGVGGDGRKWASTLLPEGLAEAGVHLSMPAAAPSWHAIAYHGPDEAAATSRWRALAEQVASCELGGRFARDQRTAERVRSDVLRPVGNDALAGIVVTTEWQASPNDRHDTTGESPYVYTVRIKVGPP